MNDIFQGAFALDLKPAFENVICRCRFDLEKSTCGTAAVLRNSRKPAFRQGGAQQQLLGCHTIQTWVN
jgi:hypothetical protein